VPIHLDESADAAYASAQRYSPRPLTEGELWTVRALWALREHRYSPAAWRFFLRSALERSAAARADRSQMTRQARIWGAIGAASWLAVCRSSRASDTLRPNALGGLLWWVAVWQMLDWHLGMAEGGDGVAHARLAPADALTLSRFWLVPLAVGARRSPKGLPSVVLLGGLTDWLDGALARRSGRTRLGRDLDSTADLAFLLASVMAARAAGRITTLGACSLGVRYAAGISLSLTAVFGRCRRPAIRARPWGAALRVGGLAASTAGWRRAGTLTLLAGAIVPPRSTSPQLSHV
jgi:phosphatidylglycerophosphate synthase